MPGPVNPTIQQGAHDASHYLPSIMGGIPNVNPMISAMVGPDNQYTPPTPYSNVAFSHQMLPHAYENQNVLIARTLGGMLTSVAPAWPTQVALPYVQKNEITFVVEKRVLEPMTVPTVPHAGSAPLMKWSDSKWSVSLKRFMLKFNFDYELYMKPEGQVMYLEGLVGFTKFFQEANNFGVIRTLMNSSTMGEYYLDPNGMYPPNLETIAEKEVGEFAILQHPTEGWRAFPNIYKFYRDAIIRASGGQQPDLLIISSDMSYSLTTYGHPDILWYEIRGKEGKNMLKKGEEIWTMGDKVRVVQAPEYGAPHDAVPVLPMSRQVFVGTHHPQFSRIDEMHSLFNYNSGLRDIQIYDGIKDDYAMLKLEDAIKNCRVWDDEDGYTKELNDFVQNNASNWVYESHKQKIYKMRPEECLRQQSHQIPFPLASATNSGAYALCEYFGQLEEHAIHDKHFKKMAETAVGSFCEHNPEKRQQHTEDFNTMLQLVDEIENITDFTDLITFGSTSANKPDDVNAVSNYLKTATNAAGCASGPLIHALSTSGNTKIPRHVEMAKRATHFMIDLIGFLYGKLQTSEYANLDNAESFWSLSSENSKALAVVYGLIVESRPNLFFKMSAKSDISVQTIPVEIEKLITNIVSATGAPKSMLEDIANVYVRSGKKNNDNLYRLLSSIYEQSQSQPSEMKKMIDQISNYFKASSEKDRKAITKYNETLTFIQTHEKAEYEIPPFTSKTGVVSSDYRKSIFAFTPGMKKFSDLKPGNPFAGYELADVLSTHQQEKLIRSSRDLMRNPQLKGLENTSFVKSRIPRQLQKDDDDDVESDFGRMHKTTSMFGKTSGTEGKSKRSQPDSHVADQLGHISMIRPHFHERWTSSNKESDGLTRIMWQAILTTRCDKRDQIISLANSDIFVPFNFLHWRLFIQLVTSSVILMVSGINTGATFWGNALIDDSADGQRRLWTVQASAYWGSVVTRPECVRPIFDIAARGVVSGWNADFILDEKDLESVCNESAYPDAPSIITTLLPVTEERLRSTMCFLGPLNYPIQTQQPREEETTYSTSSYYCSLYPDLENMATKSMHNRTFEESSCSVTANTRLGMYIRVDPRSNQWVRIKGNSHVQHGEYRGAKPVWMGGPCFVEESKYGH